MLKTRVIPCLLLKDRGLVKTVNFKHPKYVGDPINAVKIFNEKEVDELIFLDINASIKRDKPDFKMIADIASECFMPLCYGGGVRTIEDIKTIFHIGVEKVAVNTYAIENPGFVKEAADIFGSQSIIVSIDIRKSFLGKYEVFTHNGSKNTKLDPVKWAIIMQELGAGELMINSIELDGSMKGYDIELMQRVSSAVSIPVIACGGAGSINDFTQVVLNGGASAVAAGSLFVFKGKHRAVLINYPNRKDLEAILP
ncbi:MAG: AglZ/HisF2 family acetamidino modification protein [Syntrophomonas sp.]